MKKYEDYVKCLSVLLNADRQKAISDEIYRMGVIGQFNLTFELSWKAVKETLMLYGVDVSNTGSPREILKAAFEINFLSDGDIWLDMLKKRNISIHVYDETAAIELVNSIFDVYIIAFVNLKNLLNEKISKVNPNAI